MKETFLNFIETNDTENTKLFKSVFKDYLHLLPKKVCSSKQIWKIIDYNGNIKVFNECFMEYFKWKITKSNNSMEFPNR